MKRGVDYQWNSISTLDSKDFICGHCGKDVSSNEGYHGSITTGNGPTRSTRTVNIYTCHNCSRPCYFDREYQAPTYEGDLTAFPDETEKISPKFAEIFRQSESAENRGHEDIAGVGYGKAFEFLVKDYLIHNEGEESVIEEIKKESLHSCIQNRVENEKLKKAAEKAKILRNDETHYEKKYTNKDVKDLKRLIHATVHWIEIDLLTEDEL